ncbi:hypothetical protein NLG97_g1227 [Lecanicillium saksenae]|uniref:Uncharacterized protein n=1 Tax=Lecanicillium saksenae TaxID=468837 RepID=A0ACC1R5R7_9HYPO|nr:hypothetical protein NLG97_g1227 [Lecanicillium saksenae]
MSAQQFSNGLGNVRLVDREHINPMLQGILYSTDRKAQVAVLENESRRNSSAASTPATSRKNSFMSPFSSRKNSTSSRKSSVVSPDAVAEHSYSSEKRHKSSLFGMAAFGKGMGPGNNNAHLL